VRGSLALVMVPVEYTKNQKNGIKRKKGKRKQSQKEIKKKTRLQRKYVLIVNGGSDFGTPGKKKYDGAGQDLKTLAVAFRSRLALPVIYSHLHSKK